MRGPDSLERLIDRFARLPSIGRKSAQRLAYHLLAQAPEDAEALANSILEARRKLHPCQECGNHAEAVLCPICNSDRRQRHLLCVVEKPSDIASFERVGAYMGLYHVLGGVLSPIDGIGPRQLHLEALVNRCRQGNLEVILALSTSAEGEATSTFIQQQLKPFKVKVSRLARGLPVGSDLDFIDELTMQKALEGRVEMGALI